MYQRLWFGDAIARCVSEYFPNTITKTSSAVPFAGTPRQESGRPAFPSPRALASCSDRLGLFPTTHVLPMIRALAAQVCNLESRLFDQAWAVIVKEPSRTSISHAHSHPRRHNSFWGGVSQAKPAFPCGRGGGGEGRVVSRPAQSMKQSCS